MIKIIQDKIPAIHPQAKIAENASIIGAVTLDKDSFVFYGAVLRGDINRISVGEGSNIQDNCTVHVDRDFLCIIGKFVTVGHNAVIHGCTIEDCCIIGMGAVILDGAKIGKGCVVGAGAVVKEKEEIPPYSLVAGVLASVKKNMGADVCAKLKEHADNYIKTAEAHFGGEKA